MSEPKPKHGGKRKGAGRPAGSKNVLGYGEVKALKVAGLRVPESAPKDHAALADIALQVMVDVMVGEVNYLEAPGRLKAATAIRAEVCGPVPTKLEHAGADGESLTVKIVTAGDDDA